jgi:hypothetical protein
MTMVMYMGSFMMGMKMDMPMTLGTMVMPKGTSAWALGAMMHLVMGIVFFIIYAALFSTLSIQSAVAGWGALFGVVHAVLAGVAFGMMPRLHPRMAVASASVAQTVPAPGFFGMNTGRMAPMALIGVHVVYGGLGGAIYSA